MPLVFVLSSKHLCYIYRQLLLHHERVLHLHATTTSLPDGCTGNCRLHELRSGTLGARTPVTVPDQHSRFQIELQGEKHVTLSCHKNSSVCRPRVDRTGLRPPHSLTSSCQTSFIVSLVYGESVPRVVNHAKERAKEMNLRVPSEFKLQQETAECVYFLDMCSIMLRNPIYDR